MPNQLQGILQQILMDIEMPVQTNIEEATTFISSYISNAEITTSEFDAEIPEKAIIRKEGAEGKITDATVIKFSNLKFELRKLLLEALKTAPTVAAAFALTDPLRKLLALLSVSIQFVEKVKPLQAIKVTSNEAQLLLIIFILTQENRIPTIDRLTEVVGNNMSDLQILESLDVLEKLSCLRRIEDRIILNETIEIEYET